MLSGPGELLPLQESKKQGNEEATSGMVKFKHTPLRLQSKKPVLLLLLLPLHTLKASDWALGPCT